MPDTPTAKCVLIIAGETSGDHHGALLVSAMKQKRPDIFFCGIGGPEMRAAGVRIIVDAEKLSVVGITEVASKLPSVLAGAAAVKRVIDAIHPDLVILLDFPDFNLRMAAYAKKRGVRVLYYISPQIWAWRSGRIETIRKVVDHMAVILPFEQEYYEKRGVAATFVGHPLLDQGEGLADFGDDSRKPGIIGILPGSRLGEVEKNLHVMLAAASLINRRHPGVKFLVSAAPSIDRDRLSGFMRPYESICDISIDTRNIREILGECTTAIAVSGTVTLDAAICGVPMVIVYRISPISYMLGKSLIRVDHIGLVNIIAGKRVVPELIQNEATPLRIADEISSMIDDPARLSAIRAKLSGVRKKMGGPGASTTTAKIAFSLMDEKNKGR
ncbi:MAG: lipid-A-disaccharide synthase [Deltaproteobacteria bacterium]|nr:lipid-A-disaccharide synthase [Deltaproteobacteria bacterium]